MMSCELLGMKRVWPNEGAIYSLSGETEENQAKAQSDSRSSGQGSIQSAPGLECRALPPG
jgi:hypothetical protein